MMNKKWQRIIVAIIAVILALTMILSLVMPAMASDMSSATESSVASYVPQDESSVSAPSEEKETPKGQTILGGVKIGSVDVSGMTLKEAQAAVREHVEEMAASKLVIHVGEDYTREIAMSDLGFQWTNTDVAEKAMKLGRSGNILERYKIRKDIAEEGRTLLLEKSYDSDTVRYFIEEIADEVYKDSVSSRITMGKGGKLEITPGSNGIAVDQDSAYSQLMVYLNSGWQNGEPEITLASKTLTPRVPEDSLDKVKDVLGRGWTDYGGSSNARSKNIENGVRLISGTILMPGESFSMLDKVVPFTAENGYALAPSIAEGSVVDTYGGGICQVATTLYLALLDAELQVDERHNHSMMVSYIEKSKDAAISEDGGKDLQFTNNLDEPIYIYGEADDGDLRFVIYGAEYRPEGREVVYDSKVTHTEKAELVITTSESKSLGYIDCTSGGQDGIDAELLKVVTEDGKTHTETVNTSYYQMQPIIYVVGLKTTDYAARDRVASAVDTQKLEKVEKALAQSGY
jgi:vancomycin resistance protein YoaR